MFFPLCSFRPRVLVLLLSRGHAARFAGWGGQVWRPTSLALFRSSALLAVTTTTASIGDIALTMWHVLGIVGVELPGSRRERASEKQ